jgi:hypothetical protein
LNINNKHSHEHKILIFGGMKDDKVLKKDAIEITINELNEGE